MWNTKQNRGELVILRNLSTCWKRVGKRTNAIREEGHYQLFAAEYSGITHIPRICYLLVILLAIESSQHH